MSIQSSKLFFPFGSCRVVNTIVLGLCSERHTLLNPKDLWFTHYMQEHIQKLDFLFSSCPPVIEAEDRELIVRYQQYNHYPPSLGFQIADSLISPSIDLSQHVGKSVNVVLELATARSILIPMNNVNMWGHSTNYDLIRKSGYQQAEIFSSESDLLDLLIKFEEHAFSFLCASAGLDHLNFIFVPPVPYIQEQNGCWSKKACRTDLAVFLQKHVARGLFCDLPSGKGCSRQFLDIAGLIDRHGGSSSCLIDSDHFLPPFVDIVAAEIDCMSI